MIVGTVILRRSASGMGFLAIFGSCRIASFTLDTPERSTEGLSYSNKKWHVSSIEGAKTAETRQRRIAKSVGMLREGRSPR
jgi:hypothetical protein